MAVGTRTEAVSVRLMAESNILVLNTPEDFSNQSGGGDNFVYA